MHADSRQLIALRDGEPTDAAVAEHVRDCDACCRELSQYRLLQAALREMPAVPPPPDAWLLISERRQLERVSPERRPGVHRAAVAASVVVVLTAAILLHSLYEPAPVRTFTAGESVADLRQRSRELEYLLQRYETPAVMSLRTAGAISELEDGIALIDYQLNAGGNEQQEHELWRQRIDLMETLVTVRAAETWIESI